MPLTKYCELQRTMTGKWKFDAWRQGEAAARDTASVNFRICYFGLTWMEHRVPAWFRGAAAKGYVSSANV